MLDRDEQSYIQGLVTDMRVLTIFMAGLLIFIFVMAPVSSFNALTAIGGVVLTGLLMRRWQAPAWGFAISRSAYRQDQRVQDYIASFGKVGFGRMMYKEIGVLSMVLLVTIIVGQWTVPNDPGVGIATCIFAGSANVCASWLTVYQRIVTSWDASRIEKDMGTGGKVSE